MDLTQIIKNFTEVGVELIPFVGSLAFLAFVWGVVRFIKSTGSESDMKKTKALLVWGVVGMFVLATVWGIISFAQGEFGFGGTFGIPQIKIK